MNQKVIKLILMLLAAVLPTAWGFAAQQVTVIVTGQGSIVADKVQASEGELVTLTVTAEAGWMLKRQTLMVEQVTNTSNGDGIHITRSTTPTIGMLVSVSKQSDSTYTFTMPARDVEVHAAFVEYQTSTATIDVTIMDGDNNTTTAEVTVDLTVEKETGDIVITNVTLPDHLSDKPAIVNIPAAVTDAEGNEHQVTSISSGAFMGQTNVTDIWLPESDKPLYIEEGAFLLDAETGDRHQVATIHTPLHLLDNYALMAALSENYSTCNIQATAYAQHRYWTFSCGVDVRLPKGFSLYVCRQLSDGTIEMVRLNKMVIKANNGVLIDGFDDEARTYEMVVSPSDDRPSGTVPADHDAHSYDGNQLEPVIMSKHYDAGSYYILVGNEFYPILQEGKDMLLPACKAVLHLEKPNR